MFLRSNILIKPRLTLNLITLNSIILSAIFVILIYYYDTFLKPTIHSQLR